MQHARNLLSCSKPKPSPSSSMISVVVNACVLEAASRTRNYCMLLNLCPAVRSDGNQGGRGDSQGSHQVACMPVVRQNLLLMIQVPLLDHLLAKINPQQHLCHWDGAAAPLCQRLQVLPLTGSRSDTENTSNDFVEDSAKWSWCDVLTVPVCSQTICGIAGCFKSHLAAHSLPQSTKLFSISCPCSTRHGEHGGAAAARCSAP